MPYTYNIKSLQPSIMVCAQPVEKAVMLNETDVIIWPWAKAGQKADASVTRPWPTFLHQKPVLLQGLYISRKVTIKYPNAAYSHVAIVPIKINKNNCKGRL